MKRLFLSFAILCCALTASAQEMTRVGFVVEDGKATLSRPQSSVEVSVRVEKRNFVPGEFARYAQKYLGERASLAGRVETAIVEAKVGEMLSASNVEPMLIPAVTSKSLPAFRVDSRSMTTEQQAAAAAEMIFSLRKHRIDLITGEAGENVFGAGLDAALKEIARMEKECLEMFYGHESVSHTDHHFTLVPQAEQQNYMLARYREGVGIVAVDDLSGEALVLNITPSAVDTSDIVPATEKDKVRQEYLLPASCLCRLLCGTRPLVEASLPIYQYGERVVVAAPAR
ncbi:MAG: DUF4831 family protein [Alistipes sp.]|nr:DUF4831 family protein [Alistipes sp.]